MNINDAVDRINKILSKEIFDDSDGKYIYQTPLDWWMSPQNVNERRYPQRVGHHRDDKYTNGRQEIGDLLRRGFLQVKANPSEPKNIDININRFVMATSSYKDYGSQKGLHNTDCINTDKKSIVEFVEDLVDTAKVFSKKPKNDKSEGIPIRILLGERGVGKTTFINYVVSEFDEYFNKNKVMWIRVDLSQDNIVPDDSNSLQQRFQAQFLRVVINYYEDGARLKCIEDHGENSDEYFHWKIKSNHGVTFDIRNFYEDIWKIASKSDPSCPDFDKFTDILQKIIDDFRSDDAENIKYVSPSWVYHSIFSFLTQHIGFNIIAIFDGLDRLGLGDEKEKIFRNYLLDFRRSVLSHNAERCAYLVTMRFSSYWFYLQSPETRPHGRNCNPIIPYVLAPAPVGEIWKKRVDILENPDFYADSGLARKLRKVGYRDNLRGLCEAFIVWVSYSLTFSFRGGDDSGDDNAKVDIDDAFRLLEEVFGDDRRRLFQALAAAAEVLLGNLPEEFEGDLQRLMLEANIDDASATFGRSQLWISDIKNVIKDIRRKQYLIIDAWLLDRIGEIHRGTYRWRFGDFHSPTYRYRYDAFGQAYHHERRINPGYIHNVFRHPASGVTISRPLIFAQIRILQFVNLTCRARTALGVDEDEIVEFLNDKFDYPKEVIKIHMLELRHSGLIEDSADNGFGDEGTSVRLTAKGMAILIRLLPSLEYICLCLQSAPVPTALLQKKAFPIRPYTSGEFIVFNKFVAVINFCRYLRQVERWEKERFNQKNVEEFFEEYGGDGFGIVSAIIANVAKALEANIKSSFRRVDSGEMGSLANRLWSRLESENYWQFFELPWRF